MAFDPNDIPDTLVDAYRHGRCGLYVGAGLSQGAGLPSWQGLLEELIDRADANVPALRPRLAEYRALAADPAKFLLLATELKEELLNNFDDYIAERFAATSLAPTDNHRLIVRLDRLRFVLTTNYDALIEDAFIAEQGRRVPTYNYRQVGSIQRHLFKQEFFVFKAHGDAMTVGDGVILTEHDYRRLMFEHRAYQTLLATMFTSAAIIFVGASMADPELKLLLSSVAAAFDRGGPLHYAVMAEEEMTGVEMERWRKDFNVQFIKISSRDHYADLTRFLETLGAVA